MRRAAKTPALSSGRSSGGSKPPRGAGAPADSDKRVAGWRSKPSRAAFSNPRTPSVPATLHLSLEEYYASAALMGILAAQSDEPDPDWACDFAITTGRTMASKVRGWRRKVK